LSVGHGRRGRGRAALGALAVIAACLAVTPAAASARGPGGRLTISPQPATVDASPATEISVLGVAPDRIRSVRATGALSGRHRGRLRPYSGQRGASFVPRTPFTQGERVDVAIRIRGLPMRRYSFRVAHLGATQPPLNLPAQQPDKLHHYATRPGLVPPRITVTGAAAGSPGDVFLTPLPSPVVHPGSSNTISISPVGPGGPLIVDRRGRPVWFRQLAPPMVAANLRLQRFDGRRVLTWWQGTVTPSAFGLGEGILADHSYRTIRTVAAGNGYGMDLHEFELTPSGDALFTVYSPVLVHLPGTAAGTLSPLLDSIVQEVDVRTGLVVWEWHSLGHVPLRDSYATPANSASYDAFHINAIQALGGGRVLISARDTSAVYEVDRASGRILWTLGGKASSFRFGHRARFFFQHDARLLPNGELSLFDDGAGPPMKEPYSRGLVLRLHPRRHRATLVRQYRRSRGTSAQSEGSLQPLPGGNVFVGFGSERFFSEFSPRGRLLYDGSLPRDDGSYRAYRFRWRGTPRTRPAVAAQRTGAGAVSVSASWNGATDVARWQVLAAAGGGLEPVATTARRGFETRVGVHSSASAFAVRALDRAGHVLATSATVPAS
jgi:hypothetical protein